MKESFNYAAYIVNTLFALLCLGVVLYGVSAPLEWTLASLAVASAVASVALCMYSIKKLRNSKKE